MHETHSIVVIAGLSQEPARVAISVTDTHEVEVSVGESEYRAEGVDLFDAFMQVRRQLEADGRIPCVAGARLDVYPSGMSRQMSGGRQAYVHVRGRRPDRDDVVDIFEPADPAHVGTVEQQRSSIGKLRAEN